VRRHASVFDVSRGLSLLAWRSVLASYHLAGRGGVVAAVYHRLRGTVDYNERSTLLGILGRDIRRWAGESGALVVDHPALVAALGDRPDVWYMHGEMAAPPEVVVHGAARIFVPLEDTAGEFVRGGVHPERVLVTGICVEPDLVADALVRLDERKERIASEGPLTVAFFSSGAEPREHVRELALAVEAVGRAGHRALVFAARGGRLERATRARGAPVELVGFDGREELDRLTALHFGAFDVVVSPPHERSNWAIGLGVPFFLVGPDIGPFAPRNRALLLRAGVAAEIVSPDEARRFAETLARLRSSGHLLQMAENGAGRSFRGFDRAAVHLIEEAERRAAGTSM
jgi:hypothetical protein